MPLNSSTRQLSKLFAVRSSAWCLHAVSCMLWQKAPSAKVVRLPEIVSYFDLFGEALCQCSIPRPQDLILLYSEVSISKRLGANASFAAVRVALEARTQRPAWPGKARAVPTCLQGKPSCSQRVGTSSIGRNRVGLSSRWRSGTIARRKPQRHAVELRFASTHSGPDIA